MYTQCPDCQTRFRVTAGALRAAHGTVRCGRCGSAFDALPRLSDAVPATRAEPPAIPIDLGRSAGFVPREVVDLAPVIEAELARLDQAELASIDETVFDTSGESTAESTVVLVDEGGTAEAITLEGEDITLESEEVRTEGPADTQTGEPVTGEWPTDGLVEKPLEDTEQAEIEAEYDLDATDRYEVLRIPPSAYPDPQEAEREFEALVQRLQREFDARTIVEEGPAGSDEETTETGSFAAERGFDQTAILEPLDEESLERGSLEREPLEREPLEPELPEPESLERVAPDREPAVEPPPAADVAPSSEVPLWPEKPRVEPLASTGTASAAAEPEAAVVVPVGERPLSARRWRPPPDELEAETEPARSVAGTLAWSIGSLLLALALGAQVIHHYRQELARDARFEPTLRSVYERLGIPLPPRRDLGALELRQSGSDVREGGRMVVRASLTNRAPFAQPLPVLRLRLEDRWGVMIAERDFEPADYLQDAARAARPLAAGESGEVELVLADPGADAVGYRLDVCQRESPTQLRCAGGQG
jgi:predicted Zn finger-like uncharacterized protein